MSSIPRCFSLFSMACTCRLIFITHHRDPGFGHVYFTLLLRSLLPRYHCSLFDNSSTVLDRRVRGGLLAEGRGAASPPFAQVWEDVKRGGGVWR